MLNRAATNNGKAILKNMTKVILRVTDELGGCRNVSPARSEAPNQGNRERGGTRGRASKKEFDPWPSVY